MGMVVRTNTMALNAYRQLGMNNAAVAKSLEKLASGFRINRAGDDAAGLAISEKMKAQIKGLETASSNAQDGISLIQTAEGALTEVHNMLNRMVELATKSANGTYSDTEREALQAEVNSLLEEIDRISQSTNFNGINLLDGTMSSDSVKGATSNGIELPEEGTLYDDIQDKTILRTDGKAATKTSFEIDLSDMSFTGKENDTITVDLGGVTFTHEFAADGTLTGAELATALKDAFESTDEGAPAGKIGGQEFEVTATAGKLRFVQKNDPTKAEEVIEANRNVEISWSLNGGTVQGQADVEAKVTGTAATALSFTADTLATAPVGGTLSSDKFATSNSEVAATGTLASSAGGMITNATITSADLTATNIAAIVNGSDDLAGATGDVTIKQIGGTGTDKDYLGIYVGDTLIAKGSADFSTVNDAANANYVFTGLDDNTTSITINVAASGGNIALTEFATDVDTGFDVAIDDLYVTVSTNNDTNIEAAYKAATGAKIGTGMKVTVGYDADNDKWQLKVDGTVISEAAYSDSNTGITFQDANNGNANLLTITPNEALGLDAANTIEEIDTGLTITSTGTAGEGIDGITLDQAKIKDAAVTKGVDEEGDIKIGLDNGKWALFVGDTVIGTDAAAYNDADDTAVTIKDEAGNTLATFSINSASGLTAAEVGTTLVDTGLDFAPAEDQGGGGDSAVDPTGSYNVGTVNNVTGNVNTAAGRASSMFTLTNDIVKDGNFLTIGENTYIFKVGANSTVTATGDQILVDLSDIAATDDLLVKAGEELSQKTNSVFSIGHEAGSTEISLLENAGNDKFTEELKTVEGFESLLSYGSAGTKGSALTLQIGDTGDEFNMMTVDVPVMSADGLGIEGLSIMDAESSRAAIDKIRAAINTTSTVRADMGALQNRLEYTINNLDTAVENLSAANSRIRDTDMAKEMMNYTKMNVLVQSAQAMLAQANQQPQSVLQLLQ